MKTVNVIEQNGEKSKNLRLKSKNHATTCHIKYKVINFDPSYKSKMAKKLAATNLDQYLRLNLHLRVNCPKLAKMAILKPP